MSSAGERAIVLTAIVLFSTAIVGVGTIPTYGAATTNTATDTVEVRGTLTYHNGTDVDNRKVALTKDGIYKSNHTDQSGKFSITAPANTSNYDLVFEQYTADGTEDFPRDGNPDLYAVGDVDTGASDVPLGSISLPAAHVLNVTVVNASGHPIPDTTIHLRHITDNAEASNDAHTTTNGRLKLNGSDVQQTGVEVTGTIEIDIEAPREYQDTDREYTVTSDRNETIVLHKTATVKGTLSDASGSTVGGDEVILESDTEWQGDTTTSGGNYSIQVPAGDSYQFHYYQDSSDEPAPNDNIPDFYTFGTFTPASGTTVRNEQLPPARDLTIEVVNESGAAVENADVHIHQTHHDNGISTQRTSGPKGLVRLDLADGETEVHVDPPTGANLAQNETEFTLSGDTTKRIVLHPAVNVTGSVQTATGATVSDGRVSADPQTEDGNGESDQVADDGSFTLQVSESAVYSLTYRQVNETAPSRFPKDGVPDLAFLGWTQSGTTDFNAGPRTLPTAHRFNVTVQEPDGDPATNLDVDAVLVDQEGERAVGTSATTDSAGRLILEDAKSPGVEVNGTLHVGVDVPASAPYANTDRTFTVSSDGNATIQLERAMNVNGTVLQPDGTTPATDQRIEVDSIGEEGGQSTHTDDNGMFSVNVAKQDDYIVGFTQVAGADSFEATFPQDGVPDVHAVGTVTDPSEAALGTRTLPDPHNLTVRVVTATGANVSDADVNFGSGTSENWHWARQSTGQNGTATAEVAGPMRIHVDPPTDALTENGMDLTVSNDTEVTITLQNATSVSGQVRDHNGTGVANRHVALWGAPGSTGVFTDDTGNFTMAVATNETYGLIFRGETDYNRADFELNGRPDIYTFGEVTTTKDRLDLGKVSLPEGHRLNVTVRNASGAPIPNAPVHVEHDIGPHQVGIDSRTDSTGMLVVNGHYGVEVNGTGSDDIQVLVQPPAGSQYIDNGTQMAVTQDKNITITLSKGVPVTGQFKYADGTPVAGYTAELFGENGDNRLTNTDGNYQLRVLPNRSYSLGFKQTDFRQDGQPNFPMDGRPDLHAFEHIRVDGDGADVGTRTLPTAHHVNITVVNSSNDPIEGVTVDLNSINGKAAAHHPATTNKYGKVVLQGASTPGLEVNGTIRVRARATSEYAQNGTRFDIESDRDITLVLKDRVNITTQLVDANGDSLAGSFAIARHERDTFVIRRTNDTGNVTLPVGTNQTYSVGFVERDPASRTPIPRNNVTDLYEVDVVSMIDQDRDLGQRTVPDAAGILNIRVIDETGQPVEDADVTVIANQQGSKQAVGWVDDTNDDGWWTTEGYYGIEATGNNSIGVEPPAGDKYVQETYYENVTVTHDQNVTITVENAQPIVTGRWVTPDGTPLTTADEMGVFNISRDYADTSIPVDRGNFTTTVPNGTFTFGVIGLPADDGVVDAWTVERTIEGDTTLGDIPLERGFNVTVNATERDDTPADTIVAVESTTDWIYQFTTGRSLDPVRDGPTGPTRELANGTHNATVLDAWTHDELNKSTITVDGADQTVNYTVDQFADLDLENANGLTVVRDLESPVGQSKEELINRGVNVRLNVLNATQNDTAVREELPEGYTLNTTYNVTWDGSGEVRWDYNLTSDTLYLLVTGDVEDIRYRAEPEGDVGNAIVFEGQYIDNGTAFTDANRNETIGQSTIHGPTYEFSGTLENADGSASTPTSVIAISPEGEFMVGDVTDQNGAFSLTLDAGATANIAVFQGDHSQMNAPPIPNRDGTVDFIAGGQLDRIEHLDAGSAQLPIGHVVNVSVVDENDDPVPDANVTLASKTPSEDDNAFAEWSNLSVAQDGLLYLPNTTKPGVEMNATGVFKVHPPDGYSIERDTKTIENINSSTTVEFVLNTTTDDGTGGGGSSAAISIANTTTSDTSIDTGESVYVDVTLENTGSANGDATVYLTVGSTVVDSQPVSVTAGGTATVTLSHTFQSAGSYQLGATAAGDSASVGTVDVSEPESANVTIANASLSPTDISTGESATVDVRLNNTGDVAGNITVRFDWGDGTAVKKEYEVAGNSERTVSLSRDFVETGRFDIAVENTSSGRRVVADTLHVSADNTSTSTPGFGPGAAIVALLGGALVVLRRH